MNCEVLDSVKDLVKWKSALSIFPDEFQDIYFYPEYVGMHKFIDRTKALMFTYREHGDIWLHPFLLQPIDSDGYSIDDGPWFDIESAYGYGGPLSNSEDQAFLANANEQFSEWCKENNIVAEFVRFHPLFKNESWADKKMEIEYNRSTVSQNLKNFDVDGLPINGKIRNMIKRVDKANVQINVYDPIKNFSHFINLYLKTMDRINADSYYYFSETYFSDLSKFTVENGWLVAGTLDGQWVGAAVFFKGKSVMHYHLSGANPDCFIPGITNALLFKGMQLGLVNGLNILHLGGGISNDPADSLLRFKQKMGDTSNKFFTGKRIHNHDIYSQLRNSWESKFPSLRNKFNNRLLFYRFTA